MLIQYRSFISILLIILFSTLVVMIMYTFTIHTSQQTVKDEIQANNLNRLTFMINNLDHNIEQLMMLATALENDSKVALLPAIELMDDYEQVMLALDIKEKMNLQSLSEGWNNKVVIYSHAINKWIGTSTRLSAPPLVQPDQAWTFDSSNREFIMTRNRNMYTIQISFPLSNLLEMIEDAEFANNMSFFVNSEQELVIDHGKDSEQAAEIAHLLFSHFTQSEGSTVLTAEDKSYMVNFIKSKHLGWYLVNYLPLDETLKPIKKTQTIFYISCIMLFITGTIIAAYFYRKVQIPIITLLKAVRTLKHGSFSHRIHRTSKNEFDLLYANFNEMAAQIEDLIEKVYKEQIISREAMVKQLQSQINPHFLYNCLYFIDNMTRLGNEEAVSAMTQNLAQYFRYTTRIDKPLTTINNELTVVENYLQIQCLRMNRLTYEIQLEKSLGSVQVPKLLIQPLVENAVVHGIENKQNACFIRIAVKEKNNFIYISVEDDGAGMTQKQLLRIQQRIKLPPDETVGCALWNIHQRLLIHYGESAELRLSSSRLGGVHAQLIWPKQEKKEV